MGPLYHNGWWSPPPKKKKKEKKICLHFLPFLNIEMVQVVEILPHGRQGPLLSYTVNSWVLDALTEQRCVSNISSFACIKLLCSVLCIILEINTLNLNFILGMPSLLLKRGRIGEVMYVRGSCTSWTMSTWTTISTSWDAPKSSSRILNL